MPDPNTNLLDQILEQTNMENEEKQKVKQTIEKSVINEFLTNALVELDMKEPKIFKGRKFETEEEMVQFLGDKLGKEKFVEILSTSYYNVLNRFLDMLEKNNK